jgi:hypothetical protein
MVCFLVGVLGAVVPRPQRFGIAVRPSLAVPGERGLFLRAEEESGAVTVSTGTLVCTYGQGELVAIVPRNATMAVPFAFNDAQQLILWDDELQPLQAAVASSGADELYAHRMLRYGPRGLGIMVSIDSEVSDRILIPMDGGTDTTERMGQFANDLGFAPELLTRTDASWEYERASALANSLTLAWKLRLLITETGTRLVPDTLWQVAARDIVLQVDAGWVEVGCHYGLDFWRRRHAESFET